VDTRVSRAELVHPRRFNRPNIGRSRCAVWMLSIAVAAGLACPAGAAQLEGRVTLSPRPVAAQQAAMNPYPGSLGSMCTGTAAPHVPGDDAREVVLSLRGVAAGTRPAAARAPQLAQRNQSFEPRVLGVPVGTAVTFPNFDPIFHNVFSYSKTKRFDLGKYGQGKSATVTFDKPGLVKVFCDIHSNMTAFIYVTESAWVVQPDAAGRFVFDGVPEGTYTLEIWHPERGTRTETVTVTSATKPVDVAF
jgi:plastocyanin